MKAGVKTKKTKVAKEPKPQTRFGIGEWYGKSFVSLTSEERRYYASIQSLNKEDRPKQPCPFKLSPAPTCHKAGGICSLRLYEKNPLTGEITVASKRSTLRTTCPSRFEQGGIVYRWIGEKVLGDAKAVPVGQTPFLQPVETMGEIDPGTRREVGRIDNVLVLDGTTLRWCPVEIQAVYFSGEKMGLDFQNIAESTGDALPFPVKNRRPDYRSSGPKRLLPQLQTKVVTLSRWGKKTAVVVDEDFFNQLGKMKPAPDITNSELLWFVVRYEETADGFELRTKGEPFMVTLQEAMTALVAAIPVPAPKFEETIRGKLRKIQANL